MAKKSAVNRNEHVKQLVAKYAAKRAALKAAALPRNSAPSRIRNRCEVTGRPRAYYRKLKMSRIALRELGNKGQIPGLTKSSW